MIFCALETEADKAVIQRLYEQSRQKLYYIAWNILHNEADAEDAVHVCFVKLADKFSKYSHLSYEELEKLSSVIVRNAATDIAREYEKRGSFSDKFSQREEDVPDIAPDVLEQLIEKLDKQCVTIALQQLEEEERTFLELRYGLGLSPRTVGKLMGLSSETVRKKIFRCRNKMAKILKGMQ